MSLIELLFSLQDNNNNNKKMNKRQKKTVAAVRKPSKKVCIFTLWTGKRDALAVRCAHHS
jgi:uncharacterized protein